MVEVTDNAEVLDTVLVTINDCVVGGCLLLDTTFTLVTDDVDINALLDNIFIEVTDNVEDGLLDIELFNTADCTVIIPLFEMTLVEETEGVATSVLLEATLVIFIDIAEFITALLAEILVDVTVNEG